VLFTKRNRKTYLFHATQHMRCDIRAFRRIAQIFGNLLFVSVRVRNPTLNRHTRHTQEPPFQITKLLNKFSVAQVTTGLLLLLTGPAGSEAVFCGPKK
jgi:hypothetical protein